MRTVVIDVHGKLRSPALDLFIMYSMSTDIGHGKDIQHYITNNIYEKYRK